jgi:spore coat protein CotF
MTLTQKETTLLKDLRSQIGQTETPHIQTLDQIASGTVPQMSGSSGGQQAAPAIQPGSYAPADKQKDAFLCQDALSTEKHVSSTYNTCIFEFADTNIRNALNHIQKEEQQHGEQIYNYMSKNGRYC